MSEVRQLLMLEQNYELTSLSHAIKNRDELEIKRSKRRLFEIRVVLKGLNLHEQLQ